MQPISSWIKSRRAQNDTDWETWIEGGVTPTLNAFDNATETRATVLIIDGTRVNDVRVYEDSIMQTVIGRWGTGGGNVPAIMNDNEPLAFDGYNQTVSNVSQTIRSEKSDADHIGMVFVDDSTAYSIREDAKANNFSATETDTALALQANRPSVQSHHAQLFIAEPVRVRRLTPMECERLQGFPDGWTGDQADSNRYKQMGNAVAVPVVQWIINNVVAND